MTGPCSRIPFFKVLEHLAYLVTILGFPVAIISYRREMRRQRREREIGTYTALDDKYLQYLELCIQHPDLNVYYFRTDRKTGFTPQEKVQRYALFEILISIMERSYLMYTRHADDDRASERQGWVDFVSEWKGHPDWDDLWGVCGRQYEDSFVKFVDALPRKVPVTCGEPSRGTADHSESAV